MAETVVMVVVVEMEEMPEMVVMAPISRYAKLPNFYSLPKLRAQYPTLFILYEGHDCSGGLPGKPNTPGKGGPGARGGKEGKGGPGGSAGSRKETYTVTKNDKDGRPHLEKKTKVGFKVNKGMSTKERRRRKYEFPLVEPKLTRQTITGKHGPTGPSGRPGVDGVDGMDGSDGRDGVRGKDGRFEFVVIDGAGNIIDRSHTRFNVRVISYTVVDGPSAVDDGIFEPGNTNS